MVLNWLLNHQCSILQCNIHWLLFIVSNRFKNKFFNEKIIQLIIKYCCFKTRCQNLILNFQAVSINQQHCLYLSNLMKIWCYRVIQQYVLTPLISWAYEIISCYQTTSNNMVFLWTFSDVTWGCENFLFILFAMLVYVEKCMNIFSSIEFL